MKKQILIVDDNQDVVKTYGVVLDRMGYEVISALDGNECMELLKTNRPDLVLLDVLLPGLSGREVCRRIKESEETRDIIVIAMTASVAPETRDRMSEDGVDEFLLKPVDVSGLSSILDRFLS